MTRHIPQAVVHINALRAHAFGTHTHFDLLLHGDRQQIGARLFRQDDANLIKIISAPEA